MLVDRLEELLALMEAEDEDERENGLERLDGELSAVPVPAEDGEPAWMEPDRADGPTTEDGPPMKRAEALEDGGLEETWPAPAEEPLKITGPERMKAGPGEGALREMQRMEQETGGGLEGLYRQTAQAVNPAALALPVEQAGRTFRAEEPGRTAALTVDELDRAVRRDSRRYDGAMNIF